MKTWSKNLAVLAAAIGVLWTPLALPAFADVNDYEFQLVKREMKKAAGAIVAVRLVSKKTGKTVPGAVIFAKRIDMAPDGMETMQESLEPLSATEPGVYRSKTDLSMAGRWQLSLGAKVQGEEGTVESKLVLRVQP